MPRTRTTKKLAQRIDLNYFKRPTPLKRVRFWLSVLLPVLAASWIAWRGAVRDNRVFSSGRMSAAHAVLERECAACHLQQAGAFSAKADDRACLACHDGPIHHANQPFTSTCVSCHTEHRGRISLTSTSNAACAKCHGSRAIMAPIQKDALARINSFNYDHLEFAALRHDVRDPGTIKLNHSLHLKPIRRSPNGQNVQLVCGDCHRPAATNAAWPYADAKYVAAIVSYAEPAPAATSGTLSPSKPLSGREFLAPPKFASACASCHLLAFDKRFDDGVPHDKPEIVHAFVVKKFAEYIAAHPAELRVVREPARDVAGKTIPPSVRVLTASQWVAEKTAEAETLLWRKTCKQCHGLSFSGNGSLPAVAASNISKRWMPHAKFDHDAHRGFSCESCHQKALASTETSDILLPGIATCWTCHAPGPNHAESRCFECHTYHDWSKRKEVTPKFTLPSLRTGGS